MTNFEKIEAMSLEQEVTDETVYVYVVVLSWGTDSDVPDNEILGVYSTFESARKRFLTQKEEEKEIAERNGWTVYEDTDWKYDVGLDGEYADNHSCLYISKQILDNKI